MAAEKMGKFDPSSLSRDVLLVQYGSLTGAELRDFGAGSLKLSKTADCVAETVGFEPTIESPLYTLSRRAPSTTRPRLRIPFGKARP
jgi:hypothetical protein